MEIATADYDIPIWRGGITFESNGDRSKEIYGFDKGNNFEMEEFLNPSTYKLVEERLKLTDKTVFEKIKNMVEERKSVRSSLRRNLLKYKNKIEKENIHR